MARHHSPATYEVEGVGIAIILLVAVVVIALWYFSGGLGTRLAVTAGNFSGGISNGLYNLNAPGFISGPVNSALADLTSWTDQFYDPAQYDMLYGGANG